MRILLVVIVAAVVSVVVYFVDEAIHLPHVGLLATFLIALAYVGWRVLIRGGLRASSVRGETDEDAAPE